MEGTTSPHGGLHPAPPQHPHGAGAPPAAGQEEPSREYMHPIAGTATSFPGWTRREIPLHPLLPTAGQAMGVLKSGEAVKLGTSLQSLLLGVGC